MIKFFRNIRKKLLSENKFSKYLLYAIGEIILVVIGILIALSINNRNDELADRSAEQEYYRNIKQQLLDDARNIEGQLNYNKNYTDQFLFAIDVIERNDRSLKDSLVRIAMNIGNYSDFDRQGNIYETMVNSGAINLVRNHDIIESLRRLEETYIYVNRLENIHFDAVMELIPQMMNSARMYSGKIEDEELLYSYKAQNMFVVSLRVMGEKGDVYDRALNEIDQITQLIDEELKEEK